MRTLIGRTRTLFYLMAGLLLAVIVGSVYVLTSIMRVQRTALFGDTDALLEAARLDAAFERKVAAGRGFLLTRDERSADERRKADDEVHQALDDLVRRERDPQARALLGALTDAEREHDARYEQLRASARAGERVSESDAASLMLRSRAARAAATEYVAHKQRSADRAKATVRRTNQQAILLLAAIVAGVLLLTGLGGTYLMRGAARSWRIETRLLDALPLGVVAAEAPSGRVVHVSESARRMLGRDPEPHELPLRRALAGEVIVAEELQAASGETLSIAAAPIRDDSGAIVAAVVAFADVSERKRAERERELFLDALGHDLRNPLGAISLASESMLRRADLAAELRKPTERIAACADRMNRLISQLLDFARSQRGAIPIKTERCNLHEVARQVIGEAELGWPRATIHLRTDGDGDGCWDHDRLAQVLQNLLGNALEHGAKDQPVELAVRRDDHHLTVEISNHGNPIPPEVLPRLFEPFRAGGRSKGLGLGLYIARAIVEAHGGTIQVDSKQGATCFRIRLPLAAAC